MKRLQIISRGGEVPGSRGAGLMRVLLLSLLLIGSPLFAKKTEPDKPAKPTGPLTKLEQQLQGTWRIGYTVVIEGREFCADTQPDEWYEGYIVIRSDTEPAQIDFVIEDCGLPCSFKGKTSEGIFYLDDGIVVAHNPPPGNPRPKDFEDKDPTRLRFEQRESGYPATHCLGEEKSASDE